MTKDRQTRENWYLLATQQRGLVSLGKHSDDPVAFRIVIIKAKLAEAKMLADSIREGDPVENKKRQTFG